MYYFFILSTFALQRDLIGVKRGAVYSGDLAVADGEFDGYFAVFALG